MDPYLQDFNFCIFWWSWYHTIIFCWNFDWDPKSNLGPALEQCALLRSAKELEHCCKKFVPALAYLRSAWPCMYPA